MLSTPHARSTRHLSAGALEALYDGEGPLLRRWGMRVHLLRCRRCRARAVAHRGAVSRASQLLALNGPHPDASDAWQRLRVRLGARGPDRTALRRPWLANGAVLAAGLAVAALLVTRRSRPDLVAEMIRLSSEDDPRAHEDAHQRDLDFAQSLTTLEAKGGLRRISDICCADRDGQGPADDGVLTVSLAGGRSPVVILYEDTRRSGHFLPGDAVLMVSRLVPAAEAGDRRSARRG